MRRAALLAAFLAGPLAARADPARGTVLLDGERTAVRWVDGDSFRVGEGPHRGRTARLEGVNALESYGPVHRFGGWAPEELLALAREAAPAAASAERRCAFGGREDRYRRLLVECPDAARALVRRGLALVFAVGAPPAPDLLEAQEEARREGRGMWAKGVPELVVTSVHSAGEPGLGRRGYERVVSTRTGRAAVRPHGRRYRTCQWVCVGSEGGPSCMRYVPFERRHRDPPGCLRPRRR